MSDSPIVYSATGMIQSFVTPATGVYVIEAAGGQGGMGVASGGRGARLRGTFYLSRGDILHLVVGRQGGRGTTPHQPAGGGGGASFVWKCSASTPLPAKPMLAAGGGGGGGGVVGQDASIHSDGGAGAAPGGRDGRGGEADPTNHAYSGGGGAGWLTGGGVGSTPTMCGGGFAWRGGAGANYCCNVGGSGGFGGGGGGSFLGNGSGGGGGFSGGGGGTQAGRVGGGGGSYNAGVFQANVPGAQVGDGFVSILAVAAESAHVVERPVDTSSGLRLEDLAIEIADAQVVDGRGLAGRGFL